MFFSEINQILAIVLDKIKGKSDLIYAILFFLVLVSVVLLEAIEERRKRLLKKIIEGIKEVSRGNFDFKIEAKSRDEFGELANYFNEMTQQLKQTKLALEETKATLEIKVAARTRESGELAESREKIIGERTKELLERLEELEKFYRLAVGRELKMIELKKEIRELEAQFKNKAYGSKSNPAKRRGS